jgi:hypothetical protein
VGDVWVDLGLYPGTLEVALHGPDADWWMEQARQEYLRDVPLKVANPRSEWALRLGNGSGELVIAGPLEVIRQELRQVLERVESGEPTRE